MPSRSNRWRDLAAFLDQLTDWGLSTAAKLWTHVDVDDVRGSWALIDQALIDTHRVLVTAALDAVDDTMTLQAGDAGFAYTTDWTFDRPQRPDQVHWGVDARQALRRTPLLVLWRIGQGDQAADAMLYGFNYLAGIFGTEPHEVGRTVPLQRVQVGR